MGFRFSDHVNLLDQFLAARQQIVDCLERRLFGAPGKATARNADREAVTEIFDDCFFGLPTLSRGLSSLQGKLKAAHLAEGFEPVKGDHYSRELDPVELVLRACHYWDSNRWPGRNGRLVYADGLYAVFVLQQLEHLSLRIWDDRPSSEATERLREVQRLLGLLIAGGRSAHAIRLVRDARWLIQTAQGPLTRHLRPYFITASRVSRSFTDSDRIEIHKAGAVLAGGHMRSQLRHRSRDTGWPFDDRQLVALTRMSNSMDMALLVRDLVALLDAYSAACARQDSDARSAFADAILQGMSADPELLLTRLDLLGPSTMIEDLFVDPGDAGAFSYTPMGDAHRACLARYGELVERTVESLQQDSRAFDAALAVYSPLGIVYGFCADLLSNMVLNTLRSPSPPDLSLEDMFTSTGRLGEKRREAEDWGQLPKAHGERTPFEHSPEWAAQIFARLTKALEARVARPAEPNASRDRKSSLYVVPRGVAIESLSAGVLPAGIVSAQEHCLTSDVTRARATGATTVPADRLIGDRAEGRFLACAECDGHWFGVSKAILTICTSHGEDALITDVPRVVIDVLRMACAEILVVLDR
jgi:hypothetical protein